VRIKQQDNQWQLVFFLPGVKFPTGPTYGQREESHYRAVLAINYTGALGGVFRNVSEALLPDGGHHRYPLCCGVWMHATALVTSAFCVGQRATLRQTGTESA